MTWEGVGMTWEGAGMTWEGAGYDVGGCGNDGESNLLRLGGNPCETAQVCAMPAPSLPSSESR